MESSSIQKIKNTNLKLNALHELTNLFKKIHYCNDKGFLTPQNASYFFKSDLILSDYKDHIISQKMKDIYGDVAYWDYMEDLQDEFKSVIRTESMFSQKIDYIKRNIKDSEWIDFKKLHEMGKDFLLTDFLDYWFMDISHVVKEGLKKEISYTGQVEVVLELFKAIAFEVSVSNAQPYKEEYKPLMNVLSLQLKTEDEMKLTAKKSPSTLGLLEHRLNVLETDFGKIVNVGDMYYQVKNGRVEITNKTEKEALKKFGSLTLCDEGLYYEDLVEKGRERVILRDEKTTRKRERRINDSTFFYDTASENARTNMKEDELFFPYTLYAVSSLKLKHWDDLIDFETFLQEINENIELSKNYKENKLKIDSFLRKSSLNNFINIYSIIEDIANPFTDEEFLINIDSELLALNYQGGNAQLKINGVYTAIKDCSMTSFARSFFNENEKPYYTLIDQDFNVVESRGTNAKVVQERFEWIEPFIID